MPMSGSLLRPRANRLLLDQFGSAAAAYSLRRLRTAYTGPVVQVRRSNDNAESTFSAADIINGTLASWVGSGNSGFVKTWYDQSGNGRDASQSTAGLQPTIVSSGDLVLLNGKPSISWPVSSDKRLTATITTTTALSYVCVFSAVSVANQYVKFFGIGTDSETSGYASSAFTGGAFQDWANLTYGFVADGYASTRNARVLSSAQLFDSNATKQYMVFAHVSSGAAGCFVNGTEIVYGTRRTGNTSVLTDATLFVGNHSNNSQQFVGRMQDLIFWTSDINSVRRPIENNCNSHYRVF